MAGSGSVEDVIAYAESLTEALSIAEIAETVEDKSVLPVFVLIATDCDHFGITVYLIHNVSESVGHGQSQRPS